MTIESKPGFPERLVQRHVLRRVTKYEWVGACRYTGYKAKSIRLTLECGHEVYRKASAGVPGKAKCRECSLPQNKVIRQPEFP